MLQQPASAPKNHRRHCLRAQMRPGFPKPGEMVRLHPAARTRSSSSSQDPRLSNGSRGYESRRAHPPARSRARSGFPVLRCRRGDQLSYRSIVSVRLRNVQRGARRHPQGHRALDAALRAHHAWPCTGRRPRRAAGYERTSQLDLRVRVSDPLHGLRTQPAKASPKGT